MVIYTQRCLKVSIYLYSGINVSDVCSDDVLNVCSLCSDVRKGDRIYHQLKKLGSSLDWDRACFTMDSVSMEKKNPTHTVSQTHGLNTSALIEFEQHLKSYLLGENPI